MKGWRPMPAALGLLALVAGGCRSDSSATRSALSTSQGQEVRERASEVRNLGLELEAGDRLTLVGFDGPLSIRARATGSPGMVLHLGAIARSRGRALGMLGNISVVAERRGRTLEVRLERDEEARPIVTNSSYDLVIPEGVRVVVSESTAGVSATGPLGGAAVETAHGDVQLSDVDGNVSVTTGTGRVTLRRVQAERVEVLPRFGDVQLVEVVTGRLFCESRSGEVSVLSSSADSATITSDHGTLDIHGWQGDLVARTSSGQVLLSSAHAGSLALHSGFGNVLVQHGSGSLEVNAPRGSIEVSHFEGQLVTDSTSGDVHVDARLDSLRIQSSNGDVFARLRSGSRLSAPAKVHARRGNVEVLLPASFDCRLEARTGNGAITTRVPLVVEAGRSRDEERVRGVLGAGGERFSVETSVGDILIGPAPGRD